jgi:Brp/Blh family beta-carotene 15,15'-monooxygenase
MPPRIQAIQGLAFCIIAIAVASLAAVVPRPDPQFELVVMALLIGLIGVPHGVLDTVFARNVYRVRSAADWISFVLVYFIPAGLVVVLWQVAPQLFLAGFLTISLVHFSGDPSSGTLAVSRILYGGAIIVLPTILHGDEVTQLFALLVGPDAAIRTVAVLSAISWPWLVGLGVAAIHRMGADRLSGLEIAALGLLATLAAPLMSFTVFFCVMHSARHILRTMDYFQQRSFRHMLGTAAPPMLVTLLMSAAAWFWLRDTAIDARVVQIVFVGLAALTVPHMAIVERFRFSGWVRTPVA